LSVLVDTGVIVAAFNRRDRYHRWARRLLRDILGGRYGPPYVTDYIVDEVLSFAASRLGEVPALRLGAAFFEKRLFRIIPVTLDLVFEAWEVYRRHLPRLSFTDAATLAAAEAYGVDYIATVDEALAGLYPSLAPR